MINVPHKRVKRELYIVFDRRKARRAFRITSIPFGKSESGSIWFASRTVFHERSDESLTLARKASYETPAVNSTAD